MDEVHLQVVEAFRGVSGSSVTLRDWVCGSVWTDASVGFKVGETYFVYASWEEESGGLGTSTCVTRRLAQSQDSLAFVRTLQTPSDFGRVYGQVMFAGSQWNPVGAPGGWLPGRLIVGLSGDGGSWEVVPGPDGRFSFESVPPGAYELGLSVPGPYVVEGPSPVRIPAPHACSERYLAVSWQGTVRGRALTAAGHPARELELTLLPERLLRSTTEEVLSGPLFTDDRGEFVAERLPPDDYVLGVNIVDLPTRERPYSATYFPGVDTLDAARVIRISPGDDLDIGDLLLPAALEEIAITGRVVTTGGEPVPDAAVHLLPAEREGYFDAAFTDADGRFVLRVLTGERYILNAVRQAPGRHGRSARSAPFVAGESGEIVIRMRD